MIPFAAAAGLLTLSTGDILELELETLSPISCCFRLPYRMHRMLQEGWTSLELRAHHPDGTETVCLSAADCTLQPEETTDYFFLWRMESGDPAYRSWASRFIREHDRYTALKTAGDDAAMAQTLTGYDAAGEDRFPASFAEKRRSLLAGLQPDDIWCSTWNNAAGIDLCLSTPQLAEDWLSMGHAVFCHAYMETCRLARHPMVHRSFDGICLGNTFCPQLLPDADTIIRVIHTALREELSVTLILAPVSEGRLDEILALLGELRDALRSAAPLSLAVNDWGLLWLLRDDPSFRLQTGPLLDRPRRDPRIRLLGDFSGHTDALRKTSLQDPAFSRILLHELNIASVHTEARADGERSLLPATLHLPFYQTNTASRCTLRSVCETGDRGAAPMPGPCPEWCRDRCFLYPESTGFVSRWNSLFGADPDSLTAGTHLAAMLKPGVDRIAVDLLG